MILTFDGVEYLTFDCYGTLIDWERGIIDSVAPVLRRHGCLIDDPELLELFGRFEAEIESGPYISYRQVLEKVVDAFGRLLDFTASEEEKESFASSVGTWPAFPDSREALADLARHFRLVVLSNVDDDLFEGSNRSLGSPFHAVFTARQIRSYKPDPRNFRYAIERLGGRKERIVHVAQSPFHDIGPARAEGLRTVWINRRRGLTGSGATPPAVGEPDLELPSLAALAKYVRSSDPGVRSRA